MRGWVRDSIFLVGSVSLVVVGVLFYSLISLFVGFSCLFLTMIFFQQVKMENKTKDILEYIGRKNKK